MQIELCLHHPSPASQTAQHVGAEAHAQERLLAFDLLTDVPRMRRRLVCVLRGVERVALVLQRLLRQRRGPRSRHACFIRFGKPPHIGESATDVDVAVGVLERAERALVAAVGVLRGFRRLSTRTRASVGQQCTKFGKLRHRRSALSQRLRDTLRRRAPPCIRCRPMSPPDDIHDRRHRRPRTRRARTSRWRSLYW